MKDDQATSAAELTGQQIQARFAAALRIAHAKPVKPQSEMKLNKPSASKKPAKKGRNSA